MNSSKGSGKPAHSGPVRPKRLDRKFTIGFYFSGLVCALFLIPIVLLSIFELAARAQAIDFLRYEMSNVRAKIVEYNQNTLSTVSNQQGFRSQEPQGTSLIGLENTLNDHLRLATELTIKGAQCYQKTIHVLVQASFAASSNESQKAQDNVRIERINVQRSALKAIEISLEEDLKRLTDQDPESKFLSKMVPLMESVQAELRTTMQQESDIFSLKQDENKDTMIASRSASEIKESLAFLSSEIGIISESHSSARIVTRLDSRILEFLNLGDGGDITLSGPIPVESVVEIMTLLSNSIVQLKSIQDGKGIASPQLLAKLESTKSALAELELERINIIERSIKQGSSGLLSCPTDGLQNSSTQESLEKESQHPEPETGREGPSAPVNRDRATTCGSDISTLGLVPVWARTPMSCWLSPILTMPSSLLYSISVVLAGAIGSVFAAFHFRYPDIIARMFMGLVAGLVALLVIKGGKFLFVMDFGLLTQENPYSGALAGMLAGLFTERGFKLIEHLIDSGIDKIKSETNGEHHDPEPVKNDTKPKPRDGG